MRLGERIGISDTRAMVSTAHVTRGYHSKAFGSGSISKLGFPRDTSICPI